MRAAGLSSYHPAAVMLYFAGAISFTLLFQEHPVYQALTVVAVLALNGIQGSLARHRGMLLTNLLFSLALLLFNLLFSHRGEHELFRIGGQSYTAEALLYGALAASTLFCTLAWSVSMQLVLTAEKIHYLLGAVSPKSAMLLSMAMRSYRLLSLRYKQIMEVQRTRGIDPAAGPWRGRLTKGGILLRIAFMWTLEEGVQTADSMKARGFGTGARSQYAPYRWTWRDGVFAGLALFAGVALLLLYVSGSARFEVYPELSGLRWNGPEAAAYACYIGYLAVPLGAEGWEEWKWRSLN